MRRCCGRKRGFRSESGLTLIEVSISLVILSGVLLASTSAFSTSLSASARAERMTAGGIFLDTVLENVSAQVYDNLLSFDGTRVFQNTNANDSNFAVDLTVFAVEVDLLQVTSELIDLRTGRRVVRISTLRSRR